MYDSREATDAYAEKIGHAYRSFQFQCIASGNTMILAKELSSKTLRDEVLALFRDDLRGAYYSLTFVWAQAWAIAVGAGVRETVADLIYDKHLKKAQGTHSVSILWEIHTKVLFSYADAVNAVKNTPRFSPRIQQCCDYVKEHLFEPLTVRQIAEALELSDSYISHSFRTETGNTLVAYIQRAKIEAAKLLLQEPMQTVSTVMGQLGFISQSHFSRLFKEYVGVTPGKFRAEVRTGKVKDCPTRRTVLPQEWEKTLEDWYIRAEDYGHRKGLEHQNYLLQCVRRGKKDSVEELFRDPVFLRELLELFHDRLDFAIEALICTWPQAVHAACTSGINPKESALVLTRYMSKLYNCLTVEEALDLDCAFFTELSGIVADL